MFLSLYSSNPWAEKLHGEGGESYRALFIKQAGKQIWVSWVSFFSDFGGKNLHLCPWLWHWPTIRTNEEPHVCSSAISRYTKVAMCQQVTRFACKWIRSSVALWLYVMVTWELSGFRVLFKSCKEFNFRARQLCTKHSVWRESSRLKSCCLHIRSNLSCTLTCGVIWGKL